MARTKLAARKTKSKREEEETGEQNLVPPSDLTQLRASIEKNKLEKIVKSMPVQSQEPYLEQDLAISKLLRQAIKDNQEINQPVPNGSTADNPLEPRNIFKTGLLTSWRPTAIRPPRSFRSQIRNKLWMEYPTTLDPSFLALQVDVLQSKVEWIQAKLQIEAMALQSIEDPAEAWIKCLVIDNLREECAECDKFKTNLEKRLSAILQQQYVHDLLPSSIARLPTVTTGLVIKVSQISSDLQLHVQALQLSEELPEIMTHILEVKKCVASFKDVYNGFGRTTPSPPPITQSMIADAEEAIELAMQQIDVRAQEAQESREQNALAHQLNNELQQTM